MAGINDLKSLSREGDRKILELVGQQRIQEAHIQALVKVVPKTSLIQLHILVKVSKNLRKLL
jgi:hypothetical protein